MSSNLGNRFSTSEARRKLFSARVRELILVTRNVSDFKDFAELTVEDWSS